MDTLNYKVLKESGYEGYILENAPERVLQFGEGNFLRAFVDYFIDVMNEKCDFNTKVVITQPIKNGLADFVNKQEGLYNFFLRGVSDGVKINDRRVISSVSRCINPYEDFTALLDIAKNPDLRFIVSNTTESGIVFEEDSSFEQTPPNSFPAKLTRFLYERFTLGLGGFIILSCELIDDNGKELENCVNKYIDFWNLSDEFKTWVNSENIFCSTLVDRIVTGYPRSEADALNKEFGYTDNLIDTSEVFAFWVIEGPDSIKDEFPAHLAGLPVIVTDDHTPYKKRKVRILNGAHTSMVPMAYLSGETIVRDCMDNKVIKNFMDKVLFEEVIPTLTLPKAELDDFAASVTERFKNPYIDHQLLSIALNTTAKWRARVMPSLLEYVEKFGKLPVAITFSFAAYIAFYAKKCPIQNYEIVDDSWAVDFFVENKDESIESLVNKVCTNERMWGMDLTTIDGFEAMICKMLNEIVSDGMYETVKNYI